MWLELGYSLLLPSLCTDYRPNPPPPPSMPLQIRVKYCIYRVGLNTVSKLVRFFSWNGVDAMCT